MACLRSQSYLETGRVGDAEKKALVGNPPLRNWRMKLGKTYAWFFLSGNRQNVVSIFSKRRSRQNACSSILEWEQARFFHAPEAAKYMLNYFKVGTGKIQSQFFQAPEPAKCRINCYQTPERTKYLLKKMLPYQLLKCTIFPAGFRALPAENMPGGRFPPDFLCFAGWT